MTNSSATSGPASRPVVYALGAVAVAYALSAVLGLPQRATEMTNAGAHQAASPADDHATEGNEAEDGSVLAHGESVPRVPPSFVMMLPFALLLGTIAVFPLMHVTEHWWESNLHRFYVGRRIGSFDAGLLCFRPCPSGGPPFPWPCRNRAGRDRHVLGRAVGDIRNAIFNEFVPFISAAVQPVHDQRRDSHRRRSTGPPADELDLHWHRRGCWPT